MAYKDEHSVPWFLTRNSHCLFCSIQLKTASLHTTHTVALGDLYKYLEDHLQPLSSITSKTISNIATFL